MSKWDSGKRGPLNSTARQRQLYRRIGPQWNRMCCTPYDYTDIEHFSIPTSSSISLTAGESENNRATHNTMALYQQWPYGNIKSSHGYLTFSQREFWLSQNPHREAQIKLKSKFQTLQTPLWKLHHVTNQNTLLDYNTVHFTAHNWNWNRTHTLTLCGLKQIYRCANPTHSCYSYTAGYGVVDIHLHKNVTTRQGYDGYHMNTARTVISQDNIKQVVTCS